MQPGSTFQKFEAVGSCQVGTVWAAVDAHGLSVTVAMLDETVATDKRWRDAFVSTAQSLASGNTEGARFLYADFAAAAPWVACDGPGAEQVFIALGLDYHPAASSEGADSVSSGGADPASSEGAGPASSGGADPVSSEGADPVSPASGADSPGRSDVPAPPDQSVLASPTVALPPVAHPPVPAPTSPVPAPTSPVPAPTSPVPAPTPPVPAPAPPVSAAPAPDSATTAAVSGVPQSPAGGPRPPTFGPLPPVSDAGAGVGWSPEQAGNAPEVSYTYQQRFPPLEAGDLDATRRRNGLWIGVAVVVVVVLAVAGGLYAWQASGGGTPSAAKSSPPVPSSTPSLSPALPTAAPLQPGVEPPKAGTWPAQWPRFKGTDRVRTVNLDGVGIPIKTPLSWECTPASQAEGSVRYNCGESGDDGAIGGELVVRACPSPCHSKEQAAMRRVEEAWGLQWIQVGQNGYFAESSSLQLDGGQRYGLVVVAFWRSGIDGSLDRELVYRATSPIGGAGQLRRVANYIRDVALF